MLGWNKLSISRKLTLIVGIMATLIAGELIVLRFAMHTLSSVRAFVGGEGLWSKAQKDAVFSLQRYALTHDEQDYQDFLDDMKVPEGDHNARLELLKSKPDLAVARAGFLQGQIHPDDIDGPIRLLRNFYWVSYLDHAIRAWTKGDQLLSELRVTGELYRDTLMSHPNDFKALNEISSRIRSINRELTTIESEFSAALGEGSRWLEHVVLSLLFMVVLTVEAVGLTLTFRTSRRISQGLAELNFAAQQIGQGDFSKRLEAHSSDEIGTLTESINEMGSLLSRSYSDLERRVKERTEELSQLASENSRLYEEAKAALQSRDEFLSIASHELKTPLSGLALHLQLLKRILSINVTPEALEKQTRSVELAITQSEKLSRLMNELLDLTRIRAGRLELHRETCDLKDIAHDCLSGLASEIALNGSQITLCGDDSVVGNFDPMRMAQVLTNLISNAVKYGNKTPIECSLRSIDGFAEIQVKDHGLGIPPEKQSSIFERFERATHDSGISGLGLGLYITRQILEAHGGSIAVQSVVNQGTVFTARVPLRGTHS
jgi:hypothetical protein